MPRLYHRPLRERFEEKVNRDGPVPPHRPELGPCHEWTGATSGGRAMIRLAGREPMTQAARVAFFLEHGRWPTPCALHHCDNPACVKARADATGPSHIFEGTRPDNAADMVAKGRQATGERHAWRSHPEAVPRGERNSHAVLTENKVRAIRQSTLTDGQLASRHGVSASTIKKVRRRETWRHVR